jgi:DNA-binding transcriptional regulator YhcF (GntR family)
MKFWIKLWLDILHDPKMALLPDRLWRRAVECFCMAGERGDDGFLPSLEEMAWILRMNIEILESQLVELQNVSILNVIDGRWMVVAFEERQRPSTSAERSKQHRKRQKQKQYQGILWDELGAKRPIEEKRGEEKKRRGEESATETLRPFNVTLSDDLVQCPKCTAMVDEQHLDLDCLNHVTTKEERQARLDYMEAEGVAVALEKVESAGIDGNPDEEN